MLKATSLGLLLSLLEHPAEGVSLLPWRNSATKDTQKIEALRRSVMLAEPVGPLLTEDIEFWVPESSDYKCFHADSPPAPPSSHEHYHTLSDGSFFKTFFDSEPPQYEEIVQLQRSYPGHKFRDLSEATIFVPADAEPNGGLLQKWATQKLGEQGAKPGHTASTQFTSQTSLTSFPAGSLSRESGPSVAEEGSGFYNEKGVLHKVLGSDGPEGTKDEVWEDENNFLWSDNPETVLHRTVHPVDLSQDMFSGQEFQSLLLDNPLDSFESVPDIIVDSIKFESSELAEFSLQNTPPLLRFVSKYTLYKNSVEFAIDGTWQVLFQKAKVPESISMQVSKGLSGALYMNGRFGKHLVALFKGTLEDLETDRNDYMLKIKHQFAVEAIRYPDEQDRFTVDRYEAEELQPRGSSMDLRDLPEGQVEGGAAVEKVTRQNSFAMFGKDDIPADMKRAQILWLDEKNMKAYAFMGKYVRDSEGAQAMADPQKFVVSVLEFTPKENNEDEQKFEVKLSIVNLPEEPHPVATYDVTASIYFVEINMAGLRFPDADSLPEELVKANEDLPNAEVLLSVSVDSYSASFSGALQNLVVSVLKKRGQIRNLVSHYYTQEEDTD